MQHAIRTSLAGLAVLLLAAASDASQFGRGGFSGNPDSNGGATCAACHAPDPPSSDSRALILRPGPLR